MDHMNDHGPQFFVLAIDTTRTGDDLYKEIYEGEAKTTAGQGISIFLCGCRYGEDTPAESSIEVPYHSLSLPLLCLRSPPHCHWQRWMREEFDGDTTIGEFDLRHPIKVIPSSLHDGKLCTSLTPDSVTQKNACGNFGMVYGLIESHEGCKSATSERQSVLERAANRNDTSAQFDSLKGGLMKTLRRIGPTVIPVQVPGESLHDMVPNGAGTPQWNHKVIFGFEEGKWDDMGSSTKTKIFPNGKWFKKVPSIPIDYVSLSIGGSRTNQLFCCMAPNGNAWLDTGSVSPFQLRCPVFRCPVLPMSQVDGGCGTKGAALVGALSAVLTYTTRGQAVKIVNSSPGACKPPCSGRVWRWRPTIPRRGGRGIFEYFLDGISRNPIQFNTGIAFK